MGVDTEKVLEAIGDLKGHIGHIEGKLDSLREQQREHANFMNLRIEDMNKRHDDMRKAIDSRLDLQDVHIVQLQDNQTRLHMKVGAIGGTTGALGAATIESIKLLFGS